MFSKVGMSVGPDKTNGPKTLYYYYFIAKPLCFLGPFPAPIATSFRISHLPFGRAGVARVTLMRVDKDNAQDSVCG